MATALAPYQMKCWRDTCQERWRTQIKDSTFAVIATKPSMCHCQPVSVNEPCSAIFPEAGGWKCVRTCVAHQTHEGHNSGLCHREDWLFYLPHRVKRTGRKAYKLKCIMSLMLKHKREILLEFSPEV